MNLFIYLFIRSFIYSFIHLFVYLFIRLFFISRPQKPIVFGLIYCSKMQEIFNSGSESKNKTIFVCGSFVLVRTGVLSFGGGVREYLSGLSP